MIRVAIVDDHPLVGSGLAAAFAAHPSMGVEIVAAAGSPDEADDLAETESIDVVLCDLMFACEAAGLPLLRRLVARSPSRPVVVLSSYDAPGLVREVLAAGASGYVVKTASLGEIARAVRAAVQGGSATDDRLVGLARTAPPPPTDRGTGIIAAAATGMSNGEIATGTGLTVKTVESYLHEMYARYDVASRTELVTLACAQGWLVSPGSSLA